MNLQRKLTLMVATGAVALGAGHVVQKRAGERVLAEEQSIVVSDITPVAAGPEAVESKTPSTAPIDTTGLGPLALPAPTPVEPPVLAAVDPSMIQPPAASLPAPDSSVPPPAAAPVADAAPLPASDCAMQLDLIPQPGAMIGITLLAPCNPGERVVLRHAGLAVTAKTSASGALFGSIPALVKDAEVEILFGDGGKQSATITMPEAESLRRFVVQWQDKDAFQLHAFENGAGYGEPGHFSASFTGSAGQGAFMTLLGDSTTELPLLAEAFTFAPGMDAEIVLEAAVTDSTCGRELLGETIMAEAGAVEIADLTLATPACDGVGDILVLKNLMQDMKLAAAD